MELLSIENLVLWFKTPKSLVKALNGLNFKIYQGDCVALVGENGCGKTVLASSLLDLNADNQIIADGKIYYKNINLLEGIDHVKQWIDSKGNITKQHQYNVFLSKYKEKAKNIRANEISIILQEFSESLSPYYTIEKQMKDTLPTDSKDNKENIIKKLKDVYIKYPEDIINMYPHQLNGGTIQRVLIAMALASEPSLLIADEPTTALDTKTQVEILELLQVIQRDKKFTLLFITHSIEIGKRYCDKIAVMHRGEIIKYCSSKHLKGLSQNFNSYTQHLINPDKYKSGIIENNKMIEKSDLNINNYVLLNKSREKGVLFNKGEKIIIEAKNIKKHFNINHIIQAVNGVNLRIENGKNIGIIGETGCGKTTLCKILTMLLNPDEGELYWESTDSINLRKNKNKMRDFRKSVRLIFQNPNAALHPDMKVREIIDEPLKLYQERSKNERNEIIDELLENVFLDPSIFRERYSSSLSGGEKRKVSIARGLATNPEIIVADEPLSELDSYSKTKILNLFRQIANKVTFIIATHDLKVIEELTQLIFVMYDGKIVEICDKERFFSNSNIRHHPYSRFLLDFRLGINFENKEHKKGYEKRYKEYIKHIIKVREEYFDKRQIVSGCKYRNECYLKELLELTDKEECEIKEPSLNELRKEHYIACHHIDKYEKMLLIQK